MSQHQKGLKIMSLVAIVAAFGMAFWTFIALSFANGPTGLLLAISVLVPCLLDAVLGCWGIGAANRPALSFGVYYVGITWLAVVLNAVAVVIYVIMGGQAIPSILNLVVAALYLYFARHVRLDALD